MQFQVDSNALARIDCVVGWRAALIGECRRSRHRYRVFRPHRSRRTARRVISSVTQPIVPTSRAAVSATLNFQVPDEGLPSKPESGTSGLNEPANGATPLAIVGPASSSKTVGVPEQSFVPVPKFCTGSAAVVREQDNCAVWVDQADVEVAVERVVKPHADVDVLNQAVVRHVDRNLHRGDVWNRHGDVA